MRKLTLPGDTYKYTDGVYTIDKGKIIGMFELLYLGINTSPLTPLTRKDHRVIAKIKAKLDNLGIFKDLDEDSRISVVDCVLWLENDEHALVVRLLEAVPFTAKIAQQVDALWTIIENASEETYPSLKSE